MALSHGSNDAQKTMGIITLALVSYHALPTFEVPYWVILGCAVTMGMGTMGGGWRIIRTMGSKMIKLKPVHGFAAETSAAAVILSASYFGIPVSTTHIISTSIMGVGSTRGIHAPEMGHCRQHRHGLGVDHPGLHGSSPASSTGCFRSETNARAVFTACIALSRLTGPGFPGPVASFSVPVFSIPAPVFLDPSAHSRRLF